MKQKIIWLLPVISLIGLATATFLFVGCSTIDPKGGEAATPDKSSIPSAQAAQKSGAEVWAQNCGHCHNLRSPSSYSDAQWEVAMLHMRVRANLTADEHKKILAFLRSAH